MRRIILLLVLVAGVSYGGTIFVVINEADSGPGSLRQTIIDVAATAPPRVFGFAIPTAGVVHVISLASPLPAITNSMFIDGTTQPGYSNTPLIKVDGNALTNVAARGFRLYGGSNQLRAIYVTGFTNNSYAIEIAQRGSSTVDRCYVISNYEGLLINDVGNNIVGGTTTNAANVIGANKYVGLEISGDNADNNFVGGNYIGVQPVGASQIVLGNNVGISIFAGDSNIVRGSATARQVISGSTVNYGLHLWGDAQFNRIEGNYIGTDIAGSGSISNLWGILLSAPDNFIGGTDVSNRNVISGNSIAVYATGSGVTGNRIAGNYVCVNAAGTAAVPGSSGIALTSGASNNFVTGTASAPQIIAGSEGVAISLQGPDAEGNIVAGNTIGLNVSGVVLTNFNGINLYLANNNVIGGTTVADRNIVAGSQFAAGISIAQSSNNVVQGNYVGLDAAGVARPNNNYGIEISDGAGNLVGGNVPGARNIISGNKPAGVHLWGTTSNRVQGNYIGTAPAGTSAVPNTAHGILIEDADFNVIGGTNGNEGNLISGNATNGILVINTQSQHNVISANFIGTDAAGAASVSNRNSGVVLLDAQNNVIGGTSPGERNVISGNANNGIEINSFFFSSSGNIVLGNYIGLASNGVSQVANGLGGGFGAGVYLGVSARGNTIGGASAAARNIIGRNTRGLVMQGARGNTVQGNYIGVDVTGAGFASNRMQGVYIEGCESNVIAGNVVSANGDHGIYVFNGGTSNSIVANYIGTDASGSADMGNRQDGILIDGTSGHFVGSNVISGNAEGIIIQGGASSNVVQGNRIGVQATGFNGLGNTDRGMLINGGDANLIGGTNAGQGNIIAFNTDDGIGVFTNALTGTGYRNPILGNLIYSNGATPIDLNDGGVTANDPAPDADDGANRNQNFPVLTNALEGTFIQGFLVSSTSQPYRCEFFAINVPQGAIFLGATILTNPASGTNLFTNVVFAVNAPTGSLIVATATDTNGNTSEFSASTVMKPGRDTDGDGLWDTWEVQHFGNLTQNGTADNDSDGRNNYYEFVTDTQPTNVASFFRLTSITNGLPHFPSWNSSASRWYDVEFNTSTGLVPGTWATLGANIVGSGGVQSLADAADQTARVYRVRAKIP